MVAIESRQKFKDSISAERADGYILHLNDIDIVIDESMLNDTYCTMADLIGIDSVVLLSEVFSGRQLGIVKNFDLRSDNCSEIASCIGNEKTLMLIKAFGGCDLYFTSMKRAIKTQLYNEIGKRFNGYNYKQLAKSFGFSERNIRRIIKKYNQNKGGY